MSTNQASGTPAKPPLDKKQLLRDFLTFFAIVGAYLFASFTYNQPTIQQILGLQLNSSADVVTLFIYYAFLVLVVKAVVSVITLAKKAQSPDSIATALSNATNSSLLAVLIITALYIQFTLWTQDHPLTIQQLSHVALWVFAAETARILGSAFLNFDIISIFGRTLQIIVVLISLGETVGFDLVLWI